MRDDLPNPDRQPASAELSEPLRQAVEQVRAQPVPADALARSIERGRRLYVPGASARQRRRSLLALAGVAAVLMIGVLSWPDESHSKARSNLKQMALASRAYHDPAGVRVFAGLPGPTELERLGSDWDNDGRVPNGSMGTSPDDFGRGNKPSRFTERDRSAGEETRSSAERGGEKGEVYLKIVPDLLEPVDRGKQREGSSPAKGALSVNKREGKGEAHPDANFAKKKANEMAPGFDPGQGEAASESPAEGIDKLKKILPRDGAPKAKKADEKESKKDWRPPLSGFNRGLTRGGDQGDDEGEIPEAKQAPRTWNRDGRPPSFARVSIGNGHALDLVSLQVTVTVEGPRARTVVDHIFHNPHNRQLEGTFEYPLPTGASPSYFAMFGGQGRDAPPPRFGRRGNSPPLSQDALARLTPDEMVKHVADTDWSPPHVGRIVPRQKALETYEDIVRGRIDPGLLEYAGGNTFSGRVFPIPPQGYNRVVMAYEELLPCVGDRVLYSFPLPNCKLGELQFSLQANAAECKEPSFLPKDATRAVGGSQLVYNRTWTNAQPDGAAVFTFTPARPEVQAISGRQGENGPQYVYARIRPDLNKVENPKPFSDRAVFLLDTSLSEHPDRFAVNMKLLRKILESDPDIKFFNILTFNVGSAWVAPRGWLENTAGGRNEAFARLDGIVLEGATDLTAALDRLVEPGFAVTAGTPLSLFLLSDGQITWGEADASTLAARFEARCPVPTRLFCYRTGLGADNLELFAALTRRGGGVFNCFTEADLPAAAVAHRRQCFQIDRVRLAGGVPASDVLVAGRQAAIYPGGEVIVAARVNSTGHTQVVLEGSFLGKKMVQEYPLEVTGTNELAARGWGEIAVASLLALNDPKLDELVTAYCQEFGIGSRVASFLVLENDADYKRLNLEAERGKTVTGDLGQFLESFWASLGKVVPPREAFERFLAQLGPRVQLLNGENGVYVQKLLSLLRDADFELPESRVSGALLHKADVPPTFLAERDRDLTNVAPYLTEARRRAGAGDADGALRVLSSIIELYPARDDALRLVGYRLLDLKQPVQAARLFQRVQRQRPFEPHSYRDLARSLEQSGKYGLAAVQYEIILAGTWHNRFGDALKLVAREEYAHMLREAIASKTVSRELANHFGERLEQMDPAKLQSDLRVTITWNTDATDVDLWVIEPDGTKCFYQHTQTKNGGELSQDQTQGYGPERYQARKAMKGTYRVMVHYYRGNPNLLGGETHVNVVVTRHAGTPQETVERHTVVLKGQGEAVEVCKVAY
jgi:hypothetical protein